MDGDHIYRPPLKGGEEMGNEEDFELTKVEVILHEFNRMAIDKFLVTNGIAIEGVDWGKKIKLVLLIIERM